MSKKENDKLKDELEEIVIGPKKEGDENKKEKTEKKSQDDSKASKKDKSEKKKTSKKESNKKEDDKDKSDKDKSAKSHKSDKKDSKSDSNEDSKEEKKTRGRRSKANLKEEKAKSKSESESKEDSSKSAGIVIGAKKEDDDNVIKSDKTRAEKKAEKKARADKKKEEEEHKESTEALNVNVSKESANNSKKSNEDHPTILIGGTDEESLNDLDKRPDNANSPARDTKESSESNKDSSSEKAIEIKAASTEEPNIDDIDFYIEDEEPSKGLDAIDGLIKNASKGKEKSAPPKIEIDPLVGLGEHTDKEERANEKTSEKGLEKESKNLLKATPANDVDSDVNVNNIEENKETKKVDLDNSSVTKINAFNSEDKKKGGVAQTILNILIVILAIIAILFGLVYYLVLNDNDKVNDMLSKVISSSELREAKINGNLKEELKVNTNALQEYVSYSKSKEFGYDSLSYMFIDSNGNEMFSKNAGEAVFPASITKLSTVLIALDNLEGKLDEQVEIKPEDLMISSEYVKSGLNVDDKITVKGLIESSLIASNNDSAITLMRYVSEVTSKTQAQLFNEFISKLQLEQTNYTNPYGAQEHTHYTTAADQIKVIRYANTKPLIREITSMEKAGISYVDKSGTVKTLDVKTTNMLVNSSSDLYDKNAFGYKTGSTEKAGYCLLSGTTVDGTEIYGAVFGTTSDKNRFKLTKDIVSEVGETIKNTDILTESRNLISEVESIKE